MNKVIGITGAFGSGKSTAAAFFEKKGFKKVILSSFLEIEAKKRGLEVTRKVLQDIGNQWREEDGISVLAERAIEEIRQVNLENVVIDGIRNVGEINRLRSFFPDFVLIAIISERKTRFGRLKKLKRRESLTWDLFEKLDNRDSGIDERETGLQVNKCIELADVFIKNDGSEEEFKKKLEDILEKI